MLCTSVLVLHKKVWLKQETTTTKMSTTSQSCFLIFLHKNRDKISPLLHFVLYVGQRVIPWKCRIQFYLHCKTKKTLVTWHFSLPIFVVKFQGGGATSANTVSYLLCRNVKVFSCSLKLHLFLCIFIKMFINLMAQAVYSWHINLTP